MNGSLILTGTRTAGITRRRTHCLAALAAAVGLCGIQVAAAEDFALLFDTNYEGISLDTTHLGEPQSVDHTRDLYFQSTNLPGFPLSQEDLALVLKTTDPVGSGQRAFVDQGVDRTGDQTTHQTTMAEPGKRPLRLRLMDWIKQGSKRANIFSALVREEDQPGMRVDIDPDREEVVVEYHIGF